MLLVTDIGAGASEALFDRQAAGTPAAGFDLSYSAVGAFSLCPARAESAITAVQTDQPADARGPAATTTGSGQEYRPKPKWGRAFIEWGSFMMISQVHYWIQYSSFINDWQYHLDWKDQTKRFLTFDATWFDSNSFNLNWSHSMAGAVYYQFARSNNISWLGSWALCMFGAEWWEHVAEWREVISINDVIVTGVGGYPIGESWFQLGKFLCTSDNPVFRLLGFINPAIKANRWFDRNHLGGEKIEYAGHEFDLDFGMKSVSGVMGGTGTYPYIGLTTNIINPPQYDRPGNETIHLTDTFSSSIIADQTKADSHGQETNLEFKVRGPGWLSRNLDDQGNGHTLYFGMGSGFVYFRKRAVEDYDFGSVGLNDIDGLRLDEPRNFRDKLAIVHAIGPVAEWTLRRSGFELLASGEAYIDFAMPNAYALNGYSVDHDISGMKTTVLNFGYYYALGGTGSARLEAKTSALDVFGEALYQRWNSLNGRDRYQADIVNDCSLYDSRTKITAGASLHLPDAPVGLFARYEHIRRWGKIEDFTDSGTEKRVMGGIRLFF